MQQVIRIARGAVDAGDFWNVSYCGGKFFQPQGFVLDICETTASRTILEMNDEIRARRAQMAGDAKVAARAT